MCQHITKTTTTAYLLGFITILSRATKALLANKLLNPDVRYVVIAGNVGGLVYGTHRSADGLHRTISATVDTTDELATNLFADSPKLRRTKDAVVTSGPVHGFLSHADLVWIEHVNVWPHKASA